MTETFTHHCLQTDWLHEAIENLGKGVRAKPRSLDTVRISVHAQLPVVAHRLEGRSLRLPAQRLST